MHLLRKKQKILYILKFSKLLSILKLCAEILQREIEQYNSNNPKKQTKAHRQTCDSN